MADYVKDAVDKATTKVLGLGRNAGNKAGAGPDGECVCPKCGYIATHEIGVPCYSLTCPKCQVSLIRK